MQQPFEAIDIIACKRCENPVEIDTLQRLIDKSKNGDYNPEPYACKKCENVFLVRYNLGRFETRENDAANGNWDITPFLRPPSPGDMDKTPAASGVGGKLPSEKKDPTPAIPPIDEWVSVSSFDGAVIETYKNALRLRFEQGITAIPDNFFRGYGIVREVEFPLGLRRIGGHAFEGCASLQDVKIPSSVTEIGEYAFKGCASLASVSLPSQIDLGNGALTEIRAHTFEDCGLCSVFIPQNIKTVGTYAFAGCTKLTSLSCSLDSITDIRDSAFSGCAALKSLSNGVLGRQLQNIGASAFSKCTGLEQVEIPENVSSIGKNAFAGCTSLNSIVLPQGIAILHKNSFGLVKEHKEGILKIYVVNGSETYVQIKNNCKWLLRFVEAG